MQVNTKKHSFKPLVETSKKFIAALFYKKITATDHIKRRFNQLRPNHCLINNQLPYCNELDQKWKQKSLQSGKLEKNLVLI